jgi:ubiquitin-conjugating enzyme E2 variant
MTWIVILILGFFLADLFSGIFHWWEDRYGRKEWPFLGKVIVEPNIYHHMHPTGLCKDGYWSRVKDAMFITIPIGILCWYLGLYVIAVAFFISSHANEIHSWSHQRKNHFIRFFQNLGILQSPAHHAVHHKRPYKQHYCIFTNYLNPILHKIYFWDTLEYIGWLIFRAKPNPEREVY